MKKYLGILFVFVTCFTLTAFADIKVITVNYNTKTLVFDVPPRIEDGRALVPIRSLIEAYGADISWDQNNRTVTILSDKHQINLTIDSINANVDGSLIVLDVPARIENGRTLVPIRFVAEALGLDVSWQKKNMSVNIFDTKRAAQMKYGLTPYGVKLTLAEIEQAFGKADRVTNSMYGFKWHTYHYEYDNFVMYGARDGKIVAIYTKNPEIFKGIGLSSGDNQIKASALFAEPIDTVNKQGKLYRYTTSNVDLYRKNGAYIRVFYDATENNTVSAVMLLLASEEEASPNYYGFINEQLKYDFELQLFDLVNADRVEHGLSSVELNVDTVTVARNHSEDMMTNNFFDHINLMGKNVVDRLNDAGVHTDYVAENIAAGQFNAIMAHEELMNSKTHRQAILGPARYLSTGIAFGGIYGHYYTEVFLTPEN